MQIEHALSRKFAPPAYVRLRPSELRGSMRGTNRTQEVQNKIIHKTMAKGLKGFIYQDTSHNIRRNIETCPCNELMGYGRGRDMEKNKEMARMAI